MDPVGGMTSIDNLKAAGNDRVRMYIVPRAGHHGELRFPLTLGASTDLVVVSVLRQRKGDEQASFKGA